MKYRFNSNYTLNTTPESLWEIMTDVESWPENSRFFRNVLIIGKDKNLKNGTLIQCMVRGIIPYTFKFQTEIIKIKPCRELEVTSKGDLSGRGKWTITEAEKGTVSSFSWEVALEDRFLKTIELLPFGIKLLSFSHNYIMERGYRSLMRILGENIRT